MLHELKCESIHYFIPRKIVVDNPPNKELKSVSEINFYFLRLKDPCKFNEAITVLKEIASNQQFTLTTNMFDLLFSFIKDDCVLELLNMICSFKDCYFVNELRKRHLLKLYQILPHPLSFKILGKIVCKKLRFASYIASLGIESIANKVDSSLFPLFIWFLGSFGYFHALNEQMYQYYKIYIIDETVTSHGINQKFCFDSLAIITNNSPEMADVISRLNETTLILNINPDSVDSLEKMLKFILVLLEMGKYQILEIQNISRVIRISLSSNEKVYLIALTILEKTIDNGFVEYFIDNSFYESVVNLYNTEISFFLKKKAMLVIAKFIISMPSKYSSTFLQKNINILIFDSIEYELIDHNLLMNVLESIQTKTDLLEISNTNDWIQNMIELVKK